MVEFTLPKNSKVTQGKVWPKPAGAKRLTEFRVYRSFHSVQERTTKNL